MLHAPAQGARGACRRRARSTSGRARAPAGAAGPRRRPRARRSGRPDIRAARADTAMARARIKKEEAEGRWDASVNVGYQRQEFGYGLNGITDRGGTRPIQDSSTLWAAGSRSPCPSAIGTRAMSRPLRPGPGRRSAGANSLELVVRQEVASAFTQYEAARRSLETYARGVRDLARQNLDTVRQSQGSGGLAARRDRGAAPAHRGREWVHGDSQAGVRRRGGDRAGHRRGVVSRSGAGSSGLGVALGFTALGAAGAWWRSARVSIGQPAPRPRGSRDGRRFAGGRRGRRDRADPRGGGASRHQDRAGDGRTPRQWRSSCPAVWWRTAIARSR